MFILPKVPGLTFSQNLSNFITFAAAPLVLAPFVRNQGDLETTVQEQDDGPGRRGPRGGSHIYVSLPPNMFSPRRRKP